MAKHQFIETIQKTILEIIFIPGTPLLRMSSIDSSDYLTKLSELNNFDNILDLQNLLSVMLVCIFRKIEYI